MVYKRLIGAFIACSLLALSRAISGSLEDEFLKAETALVRNDYATALSLFLPLAEKGLAAAQFSVGEMYCYGQSVPQDYAKAAYWYRKAADQGYLLSMSRLAPMYMDGSGVPQDYVEAAEWYRKMANRGDGFGQYELGRLYREGKGVPQNYIFAHMWFNLAAAHHPTETWMGPNLAVEDRNDLAAEMTSDQIAEAQRLAREWKPTE